MKRWMQMGICAMALMVANTNAQALTSNLVAPGNQITSIDVDGNTIAFGDLVLGTITDFLGNQAGVLLVENGGPAPAVGQRHTLLRDNRIDTGVINQAIGGTAVTFEFDTPLVNATGTDLIFLEYDDGTNPGDGDVFQVTINGNTQVINSTAVLTGDTIAADVFSSTIGTVTSLSGLENDPFSKVSDPTQRIYGYSIDFSTFGVAAGALVSSFQYGSNSNTTGDPVLIAGIHAAVPEPTTAILGLIGLVGIGARRRRNA